MMVMIRWLFLSCIVNHLRAIENKEGKKIILKFGVLIPSEFKEETFIYQNFLNAAKKDFHKDIYEIDIVTRETSCSEIQVSEETSRLIYLEKVDVIFGPHCSRSSCQRVLDSASYNSKPIITYTCDEVDFEGINNFVNVQPAIKQDSDLIADTFGNISKSFKWQDVGLIYSAKFGWPEVQNETSEILSSRGFVVSTFEIEKYVNPWSLLQEVRKHTRVLLFMCPTEEVVRILNVLRYMAKKVEKVEDENKPGQWAVLTLGYDMDVANDLGVDLTHAVNGILNIRAMTTKDEASAKYRKMVDLITEQFQYEKKENFSSSKLDVFLSEASYLYDGLSIYQQTVENTMKEHYQQKLNEYLDKEMITDFLDVNNMTLSEYEDPKSHINRTWLYPDTWVTVNVTTNSVFSNITGRNRTVEDGPMWYKDNNSTPSINHTFITNSLDYKPLITNATGIVQRIKKSNFSGLSGLIRFTKDGFRPPELLLENIVVNSSVRIPTNSWDDMDKQDITWYGGFLKMPKNKPECGFLEICEGGDWTLTILMSCIVGVIFVAFVSFRAYKMQKYENDINNKESLLKFKDFTTNIYVPHATLSDIIIEKGDLNAITGIRKLPVFYNSNHLMLKKLPKTSLFVNRKIMMELKCLRDLNNQNVNKFWGVTITPPNVCFLHEYCAKGSLHDILSKEDVQLDWDFKHTFISDIATAMMAIHDSPIKVHGHLTSKNCLINHRWVIEVGDFGLSEFRREDPSTEKKTRMELETKRCKELLWTGPEHLTLPSTCSKAGDVYSFAIIVSEIINQRQPYAEREGMQAHEIIHYIRKRCIPPFRPHVTLKIGLDNKLVSLMKSCWSENPDERPTFRQIKPVVKQIRGNKVEIIDNMISMMEKYTNELEKSVNEGNDILVKERSKNNEFLYKSLPKPIGDIIIGGGGQIQPYEVPNQGLLLLTVHHFTSMGYPPLQCMDILNDLQKLVEKVLLQHHNVYKLYNCREELMLCSSIQGFKPQAQAQDLLSIAVKILNARDLFPWRHIRNRKLNLKITLHCGHGTGIVVGNKIPTFVTLGNHFEVIKVLNLNSPPDKIIMTKEFRKQVKLKRDEVMKCPVEILVCTYIGKVKPIVVTKPPTPDRERSILEPYDVPGPSLFPPKEKTEDKVKYMDVGSNIETMFDKWYKLDSNAKKIGPKL